MKDHFPHYFILDTIPATLKYEGVLPEYQYFESKRTSKKDYEVMVNSYKGRKWVFLKVSEQYILNDCKALYQIMVKFFETLISKFPINPLTGISAPSLAFKIWRTIQLPILNSFHLKVYDFSKSLANKFRESYLGGIVDVCKPYLQGEGYYYDVNSLYPTAMSKAMPVGIPTKFQITSIEAFLNSLMSGEFFGFVKCTVQASEKEYIGLLPIRLEVPSGIGTPKGRR